MMFVDGPLANFQRADGEANTQQRLRVVLCEFSDVHQRCSHLFLSRLGMGHMYSRTAQVSSAAPAASTSSKQVRTIAQCFLKGRGAPPVRHLRVIAPYQHFRHSPAAVFRRTRVMWKIKQDAMRVCGFEFIAAPRIGNFWS